LRRASFQPIFEHESHEDGVMPDPAQQLVPRPVRVTVPVLVSLKSDTYTVREVTLNLSERGIFLLTEKVCDLGTVCTMTFRATQFEEPFRLKGEVVRRVLAGEETNGQRPGLGIRFLDTSDEDAERLRSLVEGVKSGSVVQAIRNSLKQSGRNPEHELRSRPTSQKLMLAICATESEIRALVRDANPIVLLRMMDNPKVQVSHVTEMLRNRGLPAQVLAAVAGEKRWIANEAVRWLFCTHPAAMLRDVLSEMGRLSPSRLSRLSTDRTVRPQVRMKAADLIKKRGRRSF
jgi:uncharacterized protein (TIGR02266 family)